MSKRELRLPLGVSILVLFLITGALSASTDWTVPPSDALNVPETDSYAFESQWGVSGSGEREFHTPFGITWHCAEPHSCRLYVVDSGNHRVQIYERIDLTENYFELRGDFKNPYGIAVDANGNIYVVDTGRNKIKKFDSNLQPVKTWGKRGTANGQFNSPRGIWVDGISVYVADTNNNRIQKFDLDGNWKRSLGFFGSGQGQFNQPYGIAVGANGFIYVSDTGNHRIQKFTKRFKFKKEWGRKGKGNGKFNLPRMLATDANGNVYVADSGNNRIQKFDGDGNFLTPFGTGGTSPGQMNRPAGVVVVPSTGIAFFPDRTIYVIDSLNDRVQAWCRQDLCPTPTPTDTPTFTRSNTPTTAVTFTHTLTPTPTHTPNNTATFTHTPTNTQPPTNTWTSIPTSTSTPTYTPTPTATSTTSCAPLPSGAISWWRAENNANDEQDGNNGTLQNGTTYGIGKVGKAFSFDGVNDYVSVPDSANQKPFVITVEGWFAFAQAPSAQEFHLVSKHGGNSDGWSLRIQSDLKPMFYVHRQPSFFGFAQSSVSIPLNTWVHLAGIYDGTTVKIFVNGVERGSSNFVGGYTAASTPLTIGKSGYADENYTAGLVDEASIYDHALSASEIQSIYTAGALGKCVIQTWARSYGGANHDNAQAIAETDDGGFVVVGYSDSFGLGGNDLWALKVDAAGNVVWQRVLGGSGDDGAYSINPTSDGGFIVGGWTGPTTGNHDVWVLKLNSAGSIVWQKTYAGMGDEGAYAVYPTSDSGYIVAGWTGPVAGSPDVWVLKLDSVGNVVWQKTYGGSGGDGATALALTNDGGYIVAAYTISYGAGGYDFWVIRLSASGNILWQKTYGGGAHDLPGSIATTNDGGYILAGYSVSFGSGQDDAWVVKLDGTGAITWQKTYGTGNADSGIVIVPTNGGYIVGGNTISFGAGNNDFWILKLDAAGNPLWQKAYGGTLNEYVGSILETNDGGSLVAGKSDSFSAGGFDFWILKINANGDLTGACTLDADSAATPVSSGATPVSSSVTDASSSATPIAGSGSSSSTNATIAAQCP